MKKTLLFLKNLILAIAVTTLAVSAYSQIATPPAAGDGTAGNPYQIATLDNLYWLSQSDTVWNKHFIQTADIDARATSGWDSGSGFTPIGSDFNNYFTGSYNGKGHFIDSLHINRPNTDYSGFFGYLENAKIDSLGITNANIIGRSSTGILAGSITDGVIINSCYTTGNDSGYLNAGGLIGFVQYCTISNCYSHASVSGYSYVGGLAGRGSNCTLNKCYSTGSVSGTLNACGMIATGSGLITITTTDCFWDTETSGHTNSIGGTGLSTAEMKDSTTYLEAGWDFLDEDYNGTDDIWGYNSTENNGYPFLGFQGFKNTLSCQAPTSPIGQIIFGDVTTNSVAIDSLAKPGYGTLGYAIYINNTNTWTTPVDDSIPAANTEWQDSVQQCVYVGTSNKPGVKITGLDANTKYYFRIYSYNICSGTELYEKTGYGISKCTKITFTIPAIGDGSESNPYVISTLKELAWLSYSDTVWDKHFIQDADINASSMIEWEDSAGFTPIGNYTTSFTGSYNGKGYAIDSLYINRPNNNYIAMFGITSNARIDSLALTNVKIKGRTNIGSLVGDQAGNIHSCYSSGEVISSLNQGANIGVNAGGLVGSNKGSIVSSYTVINITSGGTGIGGLVGANYTNSTIRSCFSSSNINGRYTVGGLVGSNSGTIKNCYSSGSVIAYRDGGGLVGVNYSVVQSSYSISGVAGTYSYIDELGGLIGSNGNSNSGTTTNSYWDTLTSGQSISDGGVGLTTSEMKDLETYLAAGWDFMDETYNGTEDAWGHNSAENNGYPFLNFQGYTNTELPCQAPMSPAANIIFAGIKADSITIDSIAPAGFITIGYVLYINDTGNFAIPEDGINPANVNQVWSNTGQQCIYFGPGNNPDVIVSGLTPGTKYYFKVFAYNECIGSKIYEKEGFETSIITLPVGDGTISNPYMISNLNSLEWLMNNSSVWDKNFIQTANINAAPTIEWADSSGFTPIGNSTNNFTGTYNGKGYIIDSLCINRPGMQNGGLFGRAGNSSEIDSLGLTNVHIHGNRYIGSIAGYNEGSIKYCFTTGVVTGGLYIGGLVGYNAYYSELSNSYSHANVTGSSFVGGLIGDVDRSTVTKCYSVGRVIGSTYTGGLIAHSDWYTSANTSYWDMETSGQDNSDEGTGKTTAQMKDINTFLDGYWDFIDETTNGANDIWGISSTVNNGYPFLSWQGYTHVACEAPTVPVNNIVFDNTPQEGNITLKSFSGSAEGYVIYINNTDNVVAPANGSAPTVSTEWQNSGQQCVYSGSSLNPNVTVTGILSCNNYYFTVYSYNTCSGITQYETTGGNKMEYPDYLAPVPDEINLPFIEGECLVTVSEAPTASDNCAGTITATTTDTLPLEYDTIGTYIITWTYDDGNGNTYSHDQTVIVSDDYTAPVPDVASLPDIARQCSVTVTDIPTATDNCAGTITGSTDGPYTYSEQGTYTVTWTYDDGDGHISTQDQTVIVSDDTDPVITCVADHYFEIQRSETEYIVLGTGLDPVSTSDNCEETFVTNDYNNTASLDGAGFPVGTTTVTWTVTDNAGNIATCSFNVTVNWPTGISELKEKGVSVYPVPVTGMIIINSENETVERVTILDILGNKIYEKTGLAKTERIDMSGFNSGMYILGIYIGENEYAHKIIKK